MSIRIPVDGPDHAPCRALVTAGETADRLALHSSRRETDYFAPRPAAATEPATGGSELQ